MLLINVCAIDKSLQSVNCKQYKRNTIQVVYIKDMFGWLSILIGTRKITGVVGQKVDGLATS